MDPGEMPLHHLRDGVLVMSVELLELGHRDLHEVVVNVTRCRGSRSRCTAEPERCHTYREPNCHAQDHSSFKEEDTKRKSTHACGSPRGVIFVIRPPDSSKPSVDDCRRCNWPAFQAAGSHLGAACGLRNPP